MTLEKQNNNNYEQRENSFNKIHFNFNMIGKI